MFKFYFSQKLDPYCVVMVNGQVIKTWSITQGKVSLSSGEAEYYGLVKASLVGLGFVGLMQELGCENVQ